MPAPFGTRATAEAFDATLHALIDDHARGWTARPELESTGRLGIPDDLLRYNVAARAVTALPVHSSLVLLRPKATSSDLTGTLVRPGADGQPCITFRYSVVMVWQETVAGLLAVGLGSPRWRC